MRKILLSLSCIVSLYAEQMYLYEVSPIIGLSENGTSTGLERSMTYGVQFQYNDLDFLIKPELSYIYSPNIELYGADKKATSHLLMLNGVYDLEYTALLTPFLKGGIGYQSISDVGDINSNSFVTGAGAGLKLNIKEQFAIKFETLVTWHDFSESNILVFGGLNYSFGLEDNTPAAINVQDEPVEINTTKAPAVIVVPKTVYLSKEDLNLTQPQQSSQEIVERDSYNQLTSLTLFVPYLFRGYELDDDSKTILKKYAKELSTRDNNLTIIGHTDAKGRRAYNQELSLKRARTVKDLFVEYGVAPDRITIEGRGESEPMAKEDTPAAERLNKRIEIKVQKK